MRWFDRTFTFDLPAWMYPNVLERLRGTPARLEDLLTGVSSATLIRSSDDQWSIQENAGHLLDLEPLWHGRVEDILNGAEVLRAADLTNRKTHDAGHNDTSIEDILDGLRTARMSLVALLDDLDERWIERSALHPRLRQPMRLIDLLFFVAEHDDHHLAQIARLLKTYPDP